MKNDIRPSSDRKLYVTRQEVATILRISLSSVDRRLKAKDPPFDKSLRIGRRVLFPTSCLENLVSLEVRNE
jgi:predicted DNA-binding transcriptional regulator AlpA